jgi:hypothetical protein
MIIIVEFELIKREPVLYYQVEKQAFFDTDTCKERVDCNKFLVEMNSDDKNNVVTAYVNKSNKADVIIVEETDLQ